jgi:hypothetical protein
MPWFTTCFWHHQRLLLKKLSQLFLINIDRLGRKVVSLGLGWPRKRLIFLW